MFNFLDDIFSGIGDKLLRIVENSVGGREGFLKFFMSRLL